MPAIRNYANSFIKGNILAVVACGALIFYSAPVMVSLWNSWQTEEYSHGFIIPFIAALIGWHRLVEQKPAMLPSWWGIIVMLVASGLMLVGRLSAFEPLLHYALLLSIIGLTLTLYGKAAAGVLLPSFIYLVFCIPLPRLLFVALSQHLQLWSSMLGVWGIELFGIPVYRDGNIIDLGQSKLQVVEACGGLRYLFPLMSFGFLVAWLVQDRWWKRVFIFLSTIPITVGINSLRIALIGVTVHYWGEGMASGLTHDMEGWSLFLICLALLAGETWVLLRIGTGGHFQFHYMTWPAARINLPVVRVSMPLVTVALMLVGMALTIATGWIENRDEITPEHPAFITFPQQLGEWKGRQGTIDKAVLNELKASDFWLADYFMPNTNLPVNLYMAYYSSQRIGTSAHSPANCLPGSGWKIDSTRPVPLLTSSHVITRMVISHSKERQLVYYWFDERGRILTEQYSAKWYLLWDSITRHRTDGALVRLVTPIASLESEEQAEARLQSFLAVALPDIRKYIPE